MIDPQRTSTYERPFTHEGNYLVDMCLLTQICVNSSNEFSFEITFLSDSILEVQIHQKIGLH